MPVVEVLGAKHLMKSQPLASKVIKVLVKMSSLKYK